ncbi:FRG domain-containing protein [Vibrio parahaemolyticus]|uniref:FRG domain-containing protein n=1 Tax=Vibrio parahaemolyticus TaxID=670 RepID=UPI001E3C87AE|nr:FRG domain-containing protein [Vibrio parahaemolyticus]
MARKKRWVEGDYDDGIQSYTLSSWKYFSDFINQEMIDYTTYVYRGHANAEWLLEPTLDRLVKHPSSSKRSSHLEKFKYETRGRRGAHPTELKDDDDWWALGQHHGLATPLLDWTESPFVALYFAVSNALKESSKEIVVFAISQISIRRKNTYVNKTDTVKLINERKPTVKIVRPLSDENSRLVSQRGLFTRAPNNMDLESWVKKFRTDDGEGKVELMKIRIPLVAQNDVHQCLRYLNRMNINHSTLFPDLAGASEYCNTHLKVTSY